MQQPKNYFRRKDTSKLENLVFASLCWLVCASAVAAEPFMFRALVEGNWLEGQPLSWDATTMVLLARDGQVHTFDPRLAAQATKTSPRFVGLSSGELRQQLRSEFDNRFTMTGSQHYMVIHPVGRGSEWAERFEQLYRDFCRWVRVRGFDPAEPAYPLVAVVLSSERDYLAYAAATGQTLQPNTVGHYDPVTNRVLLYDEGGDSATADTVIHEATHQTAFNVGVHARLAENPRWLVEGLATLFEARGVYRAEARDSIADRLNPGRLAAFRYLAGDRPSGQLQNLVASDTLFRVDPDAAYAEAWALSLYLSETRGAQYARYLLATGNRKLGEKYAAADRLADFAAVFGSDLELFEANFLRWMSELP